MTLRVHMQPVMYFFGPKKRENQVEQHKFSNKNNKDKHPKVAKCCNTVVGNYLSINSDDTGTGVLILFNAGSFPACQNHVEHNQDFEHLICNTAKIDNLPQ